MLWIRREARQTKGELPQILKLSHSSMSVAEECALCGWLHARGYRRPSFPVASITHGIDHEAKALCNLHRKAGTLPLALRAGIEGTFCPSVPFELSWTHPTKDCIVRGRLDDILVVGDGLLAPLDHKSCNRPKDEPLPSHRSQLDLYSLLLMHSPAYSEYGVADIGIIMYHYPALEIGASTGPGEHRLVINSAIREVEVNPDRALERIEHVLDIVRSPRPDPSPDCPYCEWGLG